MRWYYRSKEFGSDFVVIAILLLHHPTMRKQVQMLNNHGFNNQTKVARAIRLSGIAIFLVTFLLYLPALRNDFVNWDDDTYIYENTNINALNLRALYWMVTTLHASNWHPLTWLSHAVDYSIFGLKPWGHRLTSITLHALNTFLVFTMVCQLVIIGYKTRGAIGVLTGEGLVPPLIIATVTALLFGIHPVHVESVVWLSERKDLLCAFFILLTILAYLFFTSSRSAKERRGWFILSLLFFTSSLISKPMAVSIPLVLLLIDIYPLNRLTQSSKEKIAILLEKIPFLILSMLSGVITIIAQYAGGAVASIEDYALQVRILNAFRSVLFYLVKMIYPAQLVPFYPYHKNDSWLALENIISLGVIAGITWICCRRMQKGFKLAFVAWGTYIIMLLPVLGIVQVGLQAAADRYTYLPSISLFAIFGATFFWLYERSGRGKNRIALRGVLLTCFCCILFLVGWLTVQQIKVWQNSYSLWSYVNKIYPDKIILANYNLGLAYYAMGMYDKAIAEYEKVLGMKPDFVEAHNNLGNAYFARYMDDKAISEYEKVVASNPNHAKAHNNLGFAYYTKGMYDKAMDEINKARSICPDYATAHYNAGLVYYAQGMHDKAIAAYAKAVILKPHFAEAHYNLGLAYYKENDYRLAKIHLDKALELGFKVDRKLTEIINTRVQNR